MNEDGDIDLSAVVDQDKVTSTVTVAGVVVTRTYSDGAVQRIAFDDAEQAEAYAASVAEVEGA